MKKSGTIAFLAITIGVIAYQSRQMPIYAASAVPSAKQATANSASGPGQPAGEHSADGAGGQVYENNCAICHGEKMEGILPGFPPLAGVGRHLTEQQITDLVHHGKGRMPAFARLQGNELAELLHFLENSQTLAIPNIAGSNAMHGNASGLSEVGGALFQQNCAFCHGRDTQGGETGPDLTRSRLVASDVGGNKIDEVVRNGRPDNKMPHFNFSDQELAGLVAFIHEEKAKAVNSKGGRRGVDVADLQTGNAEAGKRYFNGAGNCASCHSPKGDLSGIASRLEGLDLERRMLYPEDAKSKVTVTLASGEKLTGTLEYLDEFTVGMRDTTGKYRSWTLPSVKYSVDSPVEAHAEQFPKYTDADIHNLMAYLQTLR
jgi:mono/diheme cytochrome c family protein